MVYEPFMAVDSDGTNQHPVWADPVPLRITEHHYDPAKWPANVRPRYGAGWQKTKTCVSKPKPQNKARKPTRPRSARPRSSPAPEVVDIVTRGTDDMVCTYCFNTSTKARCKTECYSNFLVMDVERTLAAVEIRHTGTARGYGVFVRAGHRIEAGTVLDQYLGELVPRGTKTCGRTPSTYVFDWGGGGGNDGHGILVDAAEYGNWTRFVNHHCVPNVDVTSTTIGRRQVVLFVAADRLEAGAELGINYGARYFAANGLACRCSYADRPHAALGLDLQDEGDCPLYI